MYDMKRYKLINLMLRLKKIQRITEFSTQISHEKRKLFATY